MQLPTIGDDRSHPAPSLPQNVSDEERSARAFALSLARTNYNYMRSYLEPLAFSADLPKGEEFSLPYEGLVAGPLLEIAKNFELVVVAKLEQEFRDDLYPPEGGAVVKEIRARFDAMREQLDGLSAINVVKDISTIVDFTEALLQLPAQIEAALKHLSNVGPDVERIIASVKDLSKTFSEQGVTAFLRDTLFDVLRHSDNVGDDYLRPKSIAEYFELYPNLPIPMSAKIPRADWMSAEDEPWQQDWYFGWLQIAGFNTTQLKRVGEGPAMIALADLQSKMPVDDALFAAVLGAGAPTLAEACADKRLFAVDYEQFAGLGNSQFHGDTRHVAAPIALFYRNDNPPAGYAPGPAFQPICIQVGQKHHADKAPIFTPKSAVAARAITHVEDDAGLKWSMAKWFVLNACAIQHETVAHLGDCHLVIEPMIVAMHRQLPVEHPVFSLLKPHFRFTIAINHSALHSLVIPGGVVASVLSTTIDGSMELVRDAYLRRRFDHQNPKHVFERRGVDAAALPDFPMRDDTMLLYGAIEEWVRSYLSVYYSGDEAIKKDFELQNFVNELASGDHAGVMGLDGLVDRGDHMAIESFDYLVQLAAQTIYTASAQHASVNYAQYPMMSFLPGVSGTAYASPPQRKGEATESDYLALLPPIDVALYQLSFGYLLSSVQFDRLGHFSTNPRRPFFQDPRVAPALTQFQAKLAQAEAIIRGKNLKRVVPFETQVPSYVPNSISI